MDHILESHEYPYQAPAVKADTKEKVSTRKVTIDIPLENIRRLLKGLKDAPVSNPPGLDLGPKDYYHQEAIRLADLSDRLIGFIEETEALCKDPITQDRIILFLIKEGIWPRR